MYVAKQSRRGVGLGADWATYSQWCSQLSPSAEGANPVIGLLSEPLCLFTPGFYNGIGEKVADTVYGPTPAPPAVPMPAVTAIDPNTGDVTTQTPDETMAGYRAEVNQFFNDLAAKNAPDCTAWYNQLFNSSCGGDALTKLAIIGVSVAAGLIVLNNLTAPRR